MLIVGVRANESHQALVEGIAFDLLAAQGAFLQFEFEILLELSLRRVFKEAVLADVVSTGEDEYWIMKRRHHKFEANTADVGLYLMSDLFAQLLCLLVCVSGRGIVNALHE